MKSILLVEDEHDIKEALRIRLQREGFKVHFAGTAEQGLELATEKKPDLIVMDIFLPGEIDGLEATYRVKHDDLLKDTPVVILTVKAAEEDKKHGLRGGADAYLTKPFDYEELISTIKSLLGEK